MMDQNQKH